MAKNKELYIPVNVPESEDFISGFGNKELAITTITFFVAIVLAIITYVSTDSVFKAVFIAAVLLAVVIIAIKRDKYDESIIDKIKLVNKYRKSQKKFVYEFYNIYEVEED